MIYVEILTTWEVVLVVPFSVNPIALVGHHSNHHIVAKKICDCNKKFFSSNCVGWSERAIITGGVIATNARHIPSSSNNKKECLNPGKLIILYFTDQSYPNPMAITILRAVLFFLWCRKKVGCNFCYVLEMSGSTSEKLLFVILLFCKASNLILSFLDSCILFLGLRQVSNKLVKNADIC